ncbi:hypothetical protein T439DRAFT_326196 [Meredithblackwellia eburnea MCA 4105]
MQLPGLSSVSNFVSNRRKTFTWLAGSVGAVYVVSQWGMKKIEDMAQKSKKDRLDAENLTRRFNLNQEDCAFTIRALLPSVGPQLLSSMDVEASSAKLAQLAAQVKAREREMSELAAAAAEEEERKRKYEEEEGMTKSQLQVVEDLNEAPPVPHANGKEEEGAGSELQPEESQHEENKGEVEPAKDSEVNGNTVTPILNGYTVEEAKEKEEATPTAAANQDLSLSKSWAEVVKTGTGEAEEVQKLQRSEPETLSAAQAPSPPPPPPEPEQSRAELWTDIKILSFTRTITSLYILSLLSLQTHIQLNLLGRTSYITSVITAIPKSSSSTSLASTQESDNDLERALYALHKQDDTVTEGIERMYLTFTWWLLHRGWIIIGDRVKAAVEEVVGSMALKSTIVYGELPTLLAQIRKLVDFNEDGTPFDFSPALHPPTLADEILTLSSGGPPAEGSTGSRPSIPPPLRNLLNETTEFTSSRDGVLVLYRIVDALFSCLVDKLEGPFKPRVGTSSSGSDISDPSQQQGSRFEDVTEKTVKLAALLPTIARQSHLIINGMPNEYADAVEGVRELAELSAIVYSSYDPEDVRRSC